MLERPEQGPVDIGRVAGRVDVSAKPRSRLRVDRQGIAPSALARYAQRIEAPVLVQIADLERGDLRAPESDLQADGSRHWELPKWSIIARCTK